MTLRNSTESLDDQLSEMMGTFYADPLGYVMFNFPWTEERSIQLVKLEDPWRDLYQSEFGPDAWACEFLEELGVEIRKRRFNGVDPVEPIRFATVSGHEIGKSTLVAWLIKFIMDTRPMSQGTVTAVTDEQLRSRTWAELGKWHYMSLTEHWFNYSSSRGNMVIAHKNPAWAGTWKCVAKTAREERSESFAGQHAPTATSFFIFDEASGIGAKVFEVREGGLSSGEPMVFDFGNGTRNSGTFYEECAGHLQSRFIVRSIDSRDVSITNKQKIQADVEAYGEDSDFVRTRWRGLFPAVGATQFNSTELVLEAMGREPPSDNPAARVMGVDPARFGDDDSVIWPRKGVDARSFGPWGYKGLDTVQLTAKVIEHFNYFKGLGDPVEMIFVDEGTFGAGVVDNLRHAGYPVMGVQFGSRPSSNTYRIKADELWGLAREDLTRLCLPDRGSEHGDRIFSDATGREYGMTVQDRVSLEKKDDMKKRGLPSPDYWDALATTYAMPVVSRAQQAIAHNTSSQPAVADYDPHAAMLKELRG